MACIAQIKSVDKQKIAVMLIAFMVSSQKIQEGKTLMFIVMESAAQVRGKMRDFGRYRRIAVCEVEEGKTPAMISERARGMVRIVQEWSRMHQGKTERSEYWIARREAERMVSELNGAAK